MFCLMRACISAQTNRSQLGWVTSAVLLAAAIVTWPELFIDVTVFHPPAWAAFLPHPLLVLLIVPAAALLPAALLPRTPGELVSR